MTRAEWETMWIHIKQIEELTITIYYNRKPYTQDNFKQIQHATKEIKKLIESVIGQME
jgi:hypothetical protein